MSLEEAHGRKVEAMKRCTLFLLLLCLFGCSKQPDIRIGVDDTDKNKKVPPRISVLSWNIESDGSNPDVILHQLNELKQELELNIVALSEVPEDSLPEVAQLFGDESSSHLGNTGNNDRLAIVWDSRIYDALERLELREIDGFRLGEGGHRAPICVRLRRIADGREFILMNNHLARGKAEMRNGQAEKLVEWARGQSTAIIAVGDYNMDLDFKSRMGNEAFSIIQRDGIFKWIEPKELIDTNWADREKDGLDDYPDSMLDFVFVANSAKSWQIEVENIVRAGDFPDTEETSDHRPVLTIVE